MSNKTKAQLLKEIEDLKQQITTLQNKIVVPIQGTNTGAKAPTQNKNTDGIQSIKEPEREPLHKPDQPDPDTIAPSYNQLAEIARLLATFSYRPTIKVASMESASLYIQHYHNYLNHIDPKPWRQYSVPDERGNTIKLYGDDYKSAIGLQQTLLLNYYLKYFNIDMKEEN